MKEDTIYIKGFNYGFLISQFAPSLAARLRGIDSAWPFYQALAKGMEEYDRSRKISRFDELRRIRGNDKGQDRDRER
ncbi:MAG: hypothetical protein WD077_14290 [Bacteroidia bacterium]